MKNTFIKCPWRNDFPMLSGVSQHKKLVYLDSASTTLKPVSVINAVNEFYNIYTSNVSRSSHFLSSSLFELFDIVREKVSSFIGSGKDEIIFTHNCSDSINFVASSLSLSKDDEVILSVLEHHSNYLPWYERAKIKVASIDENGIIDLNHLVSLLTKKTKLISVTYISNVTGNIQPIREIARIAKENGVLLMVDAAQAVGHIPVNVCDIDCDFMAFSAHKMLGPSGVGVLYAKKDVQHLLRLTRFGGGMVNKIFHERIEYLNGYSSFEVGTPNIEGILGLGAAIDYFNDIGIEHVFAYLGNLEKYCRFRLCSLTSINMPFAISNECHSPIFSFRPNSKKFSLNYIANILSDAYGVAVRDGYQCSQPLYHSKNIDGAIRVSLHLYNTIEDIDRLIFALKNTLDIIA